ncbi:MAG: peptidase S41 [Candidatus Melainabacteria bacterium]|nr:MAG: peptidase S41 [Candidatus Melainabacteria bacterium]
MLNKTMRKRVKAVILFVGAALTLFAANAFYLNNHNPFLEVEQQKINTSQVSPQKLFDTTWQIIKNEYYDPSFNKQAWARWKNHYRGKIKTEEDAKVAIDTMLASLDDPYSRFLTKEDFAEQNSSITSKISGIGVNIISDSGKIRIISVIDNTPAQFADLKVGDIILAIDDKKVSGHSLADVSNMVRGPVNTFVNIDVLRKKELIKKKIIRKEFTIKTVKSSIDKNIGYIQIASFISNSTPNEFLEALENTNNTDGLIIDLRGNTGGLLPNAIFISNLFIQKGKIVSIVGRNGYHYDIMAQDNNVNIEKPVILLVDGASASASEIFSGAMKDYHRAKLVGTRTYGKGMVQKIISLPNETGINLTIAKYLTPKGNDINKQGIEPDVKKELKRTDIQAKRDTQLETAKNMMEKMISSR